MKISCIILSMNHSFTNDRLIPSIIKNSDMSSTEIIVVDNNQDDNFHCNNDDIKIIKSEPYHIPKGYNLGVTKSNGEYIALFHDDCFLDDNTWIDKALNLLDDEVYAVTPDINYRYDGNKQTQYATFKEVPLVMKRSVFLKIGGYDETYYFGFEDQVLSDSIINMGKKIAKLDIKYFHFGGLDTILFWTNSTEREILNIEITDKTTDILLEIPCMGHAKAMNQKKLDKILAINEECLNRNIQISGYQKSIIFSRIFPMTRLELDLFISDHINYPNIGKYRDMVIKNFLDGNDIKRGKLEEIIHSCNNRGSCFNG